MTVSLRAYFMVVIAAMLAVTFWAGSLCPLWAVPRPVATHPWFVATLCDAYFGFLTFFGWVAYRETGWAARLLWLVAILLLGNIAMAAYASAAVWRVPATAPASAILLRGRPTPIWVPIVLLGGLAAVTLAAR